MYPLLPRPIPLLPFVDQVRKVEFDGLPNFYDFSWTDNNAPHQLVTGDATKMDEFSEKFQRWSFSIQKFMLQILDL